MSELNSVLNHIDTNLDQSLARLFDLLRIKSISTDPAYAAPCRAAAEWLSKELTGIGFRSSVRSTAGHPMVVAHDEGADSNAHVLFYGHYDVQPVDPPELWEHPPFEPRIAQRPDGSKIIRARGVADDKGQLMTFVEACRAWRAVTGRLPVNVSILFEGEEESGSPSLIPFLNANKDELSADVALVCDTGMWDRDTPAVATSLRGMVTEEVAILAADRDLHSGYYGGAAHNPITILIDILSRLHDETGRVTLPGFYHGVPETPPQIKAQWAELGFDPVAFLGAVGLSHPAGEADRSVLEQIWARPTCDINGITGGYAGDGFKTVIPAQASAKLSFRLVGDQDPILIRDAFRDFVRAHLPEGCAAEFIGHGASRASSSPTDSPALAKSRAALAEEWDRPAPIIGMGGSIPIVGNFKRILGMDSLLIGFGLDDDRIHSPNEKYEMSSFRGGIRSWARILDALSH